MLTQSRLDDPAQEPDTIGVDGSMRYLGDVGVKLDEVVVLAVLSEVSAPTMGELTRNGFVEGWKTHQYVTLSSASSQDCENLSPYSSEPSRQCRYSPQTTKCHCKFPPLAACEPRFL